MKNIFLFEKDKQRMALAHTAFVMYVGVVTACVALRIATCVGPSVQEQHALDMVIRSKKMMDVVSNDDDRITAMQRLASAQATLQCARQLCTDHHLERFTEIDVGDLARDLVQKIATLHDSKK